MQVRKVDDPGKNLSRGAKRARVTAAGGTPAVGPYAAAATAGRLAPPDQRKHAAVTQLAGTAAGGSIGLIGGSQAAARLAQRSPKIDRKLQNVERRTGDAKIKALSKLPTRFGRKLHDDAVANRGKPGRGMQAVHRIEARGGRAGKFVRPLAARPSAAIVGGLAGKAVLQAAGSQGAYTHTLNRERHSRYRQPVGKAVGQSKREQREQLRRKKHNLGLTATGAGLGAAGVGILATRELGPHLPRVGAKIARKAPQLDRAGLASAIVGGGVGAASSTNSIRIQRRDLAAQEKELTSKAIRVPSFRRSTIATRRTANGLVAVRRSNTVSKKIQTSVSDDEVKRYTGQYGTRGPLPRTLDRETRRKAYEARYVAAGGPKGEKWKRRAETSDHITGAGVAVGGAAGATELAARNRRVAARLQNGGRNVARFREGSAKVGIAAGTAAAASELFHRHAEHRQSSYKHSPAGVAASALRRMQQYDEE